MWNIAANMAVVPSASKFPPTRTLEPCYDHVIPSRRKRGIEVRKFEKVLLERSTKDGWPGNVEKLKNRLTNQISSLQRSIHLHEQYLDEATPTLTALLSAAKESPSQTARIISCHGDETAPSLEEYKGHGIVQCGATRGCAQKALPFSRCCLQHITKDEDQLLYRSCIALNASTLTQCSHPVTDVLAKDSICTKHAKTGLQLSEGVGGAAQKPRQKRTKLTFARSKVAKIVAAQRAKKRATGMKSKSKTGGSNKKASEPPNAVSMATTAEDSSFPNKEVSNLSSSSWSSGESDEGEPPPLAMATNDTTTPAGSTETMATAMPALQSDPSPASLDDLPTLTPTQAPPPLPSLQLVPPVFADLGAMMMDEDSNSDAGVEPELTAV